MSEMYGQIEIIAFISIGVFLYKTSGIHAKKNSFECTVFVCVCMVYLSGF